MTERTIIQERMRLALTTSNDSDEWIEQMLSELRSLRAEAAKVAILERDLDECKAHLQAAGTLMGKYKDAAIALEPEAEAWRAVRERSDARESHYKVHHEVLRQIARLDAMKEGSDEHSTPRR